MLFLARFLPPISLAPPPDIDGTPTSATTWWLATASRCTSSPPSRAVPQPSARALLLAGLAAVGLPAALAAQVAPDSADRPEMRHLPRFGLPDLPPSADTWDTVRRPPRHTDEALTGTARAWLRKLPAGRRPQQLCTQFPRLANLIAWHWPDPVQTHAVLDDLLTDCRGGRTGFPNAVLHELKRLRDYHQRVGDSELQPGYLELLRRIWPRH